MWARRMIETIKFSMILFLCLQFAPFNAESKSKLLFYVTDKDNLKKYSFQSCKAEVTSGDKNIGRGLKLNFEKRKEWPHIKFYADEIGYISDWSDYNFLGVTISTPEDKPIKVCIRIDSGSSGDKNRTGNMIIPPDEKRRMILALDNKENIKGMIGQPPRYKNSRKDDIKMNISNAEIDLKKIKNFQIFMSKLDESLSILVYKIELIKSSTINSEAFVDKFGQYKHGTWPGKLNDEKDFKLHIKKEQEDLKKHPALKDRNKFGGWKTGPKLKATGHFWVQKYKEKWWIVDPDGMLFWSSGITCINLNQETSVGDREELFSWLPDNNDPFAKFYNYRGGRKTYNFYTANIYRKYGRGYEKQFYDLAMKRMISWGFNTIGNWSDRESWERKKVPYTIPVSAWGVPRFVMNTRIQAGGKRTRQFPDVFNPEFEHKLNKAFEFFAEYKDDPWLLGVFIDNELPWNTYDHRTRTTTRLAEVVLTLSDSYHIKQAAIDHLKKKFSSVDKINKAWGKDLKNWDEAFDPMTLSHSQRSKAEKDLIGIDSLIANQYFRLCSETMTRHLPNKLNLGCRFHVFNPEIVEIAKKYCDIVTFNIYKEFPTDKTVDELALKFDFPVLIGEYHFGALDRGMFHTGLVKAKDQDERAEKFTQYLRTAVESSWCVGAHWFQYKDQALTGRFDGENYNIGFITGTDDPHPEMREAARKIHAELYKLR